ncbi:MAG TPA: hypothetical protein VGR26_12000 [Acidimicrobiales bacterium]|nr:hypothetical protein [Acidimicrobiales bacterium]
MELPEPEDEGRHPPDAEQPAWEESWDLDFTTTDGTLGGYVRLALKPAKRQAGFWAALVGQGRRLVTVVDHEVTLPRGTELDLRAEGLWTSLTCETPLEHWSVGLEAFGVALDDPAEAWRSLRGDRTALGLDLEWETVGLPSTAPSPHGYHLPCLVHGEVLVADEVIAFDGWGGRSHTWGRRRWDRAWSIIAGRLEDGTTWYAHRPGALPPPGRAGLPGPGRIEVEPAGGTDRLELSMTPLHHAPVGLSAVDGGPSRLGRSLCRYTVPDGRRGVGWGEWNQPGIS